MSALLHDESAALLPVLAQEIVGRIGVRSLVLKGLAANHYGVRRRRTSSDVDLWVAPDRFADCVRAFEAAGWWVVGGLSPESRRVADGVTLHHELWPQPIDLHRRFTGFTASDTDVFEALWADRAVVVSAHQQVVITGAAGSLLIQALHALRDPHLPFASELDEASSWLADAGAGVQDTVAALAVTAGAAGTAAPLFERAGVAAPASAAGAEAEGLLAFRVRSTRGDNFTADYLSALRRRPVWSWPWAALSFVLASEKTLRDRYGNLPPGRRGLWRARWWRVRDGLVRLPEALRILRRARRR